MTTTTTALTDDYTALLAAIIADPADDAPRLILADWLDENGEAERSELIKVQVELARVKDVCDPNCRRRNQRSDRCGSYVDRDGNPSPCIDCWVNLHHHNNELLAGHGHAWAENELLKPIGFYESESLVRGIKWEYRRGFIARVECTTETLMGRRCKRCIIPDTEPLARNNRISGCEDCNGTGCIPGIATALARAVPLEECVLTDKRPHRDGLQCGWTRFDGYTNLDDPSGLPDELFKRLKGHDESPEYAYRLGLAVYNSEPAAITALSKAAALYCRKEAGLT